MSNHIRVPITLLSVVLGLAGVAVACGAGQKIESGGEQLDRAIDRDTPKLKREVDGLLYADSGAKALDAGGH